jgi:bifunctional isochorismate lyase/aryl carrier protein
MALPRIDSYALPSDVRTDGKATWRPDPARVALLIHDMQEYFVGAFPVGAEPIVSVVANIAALRAACEQRGIPVFFTAQPGGQTPEDRGLQRHFWGPGMRADGRDPAIVSALAPTDENIVLTKWRYSAFQRTTLEPMLRARGRDQLIVTGVYAHIGCLLTAADAFMRDVEPFFVADAVADFSREHHDMAVRYVAERCGAATTTSRLLSELRSD